MDQDLESPERLYERPSLVDRLVAFLEVAIVGVGATFLLVQVMQAFGISQESLLNDVRILVLYLILEALITLLLIFLLLGLRGEGWSTLAPNPTTSAELKYGIAVLPLLVVTVLVSGLLFQWFLPDWVTQENPVLNLLQQPLDLLLFLLSSIFAGGIKEEIQRAFVLVRFEKFLGGSLIGLVFWSAVFGLGHLSQGADNAVRAALLGLVLGLIYLRRRNPVACMAAHALYDIAVVLFTWFVLR